MKCLSGCEIGAILCGIDEFSDDYKERVKENEAVAQGVQTLLCIYKAMHTCKFVLNAKIYSPSIWFGWVFGGNSHKIPSFMIYYVRP